MGNINVTETGIEGLCVIEPEVHRDARGYFVETYNKKDMEDADLRYDFVQDNQSRSVRGVIRGLHFQIEHPQAKLVRVLEGEVFDVAVDLRKGSKTFGLWYGTHLSVENGKQFLIPRGFAHGFEVLSDTAVFCYKCDDFYYPGDEGGIRWNDPDLNISWPERGEPILSEKDRVLPFFRELVHR